MPTWNGKRKRRSALPEEKEGKEGPLPACLPARYRRRDAMHCLLAGLAEAELRPRAAAAASAYEREKMRRSLEFVLDGGGGKWPPNERPNKRCKNCNERP